MLFSLNLSPVKPTLLLGRMYYKIGGGGGGGFRIIIYDDQRFYDDHVSSPRVVCELYRDKADDWF